MYHTYAIGSVSGTTDSLIQARAAIGGLRDIALITNCYKYRQQGAPFRGWIC